MLGKHTRNPTSGRIRQESRFIN